MDIHKPKAAHSIREFLIEIGTIICGILIALGLEQVVDARHWSEVVSEAKRSIHVELALATVLAEERQARHACADTYLEGLTKAIIASPAKWTPPPFDYCGQRHDSIFFARWRPWPGEFWRSTVAAGVMPHFEARYGGGASFVFNFISQVEMIEGEESKVASELQPLNYPVTLTPDGKLGFLKTITALRDIDQRVVDYSGDIEGSIRELGEAPTKTELAAVEAKVPYLFLAPGEVVNQKR